MKDENIYFKFNNLKMKESFIYAADMKCVMQLVKIGVNRGNGKCKDECYANFRTEENRV